LPGFDELAPQPIVPEHVWKNVADPVTFTNENPVATGPFTEVRMFAPQLFVLGKNPRYWQPGKPAVDALRFPSFPNNDRANLALAFGEIDWAGNFVPAIDRVFVARDPEHNAYWSPLTGSTIFLYPNTKRPPLDDARVRKAMSMAIDRKLLVEVAMHGYSRPSDATALSDAYTTWRDESALGPGDTEWVKHDPAKAAALLDLAGYRAGPDGLRRGPDGKVLEHEVATVSGWSDWVRAAEVIARGLRAVGVSARVRSYDFAAWFQHLQLGEFDLSLGWSVEGPTPYVFYRYLMASDTVKPLGVSSETNWHRFGSPVADRLLAEFEVEADDAKQHELVRGLSREFAATAPAIPLYPNPSWAEYSTRRFTGFPTVAAPYADPSPIKDDRGGCLLVLTTLVPR
jgi:peptide/nickel transport system substrate-binding protein